MMIIPAVFVFLGRDGMASGPSPDLYFASKGISGDGRRRSYRGTCIFLMLGFAALTSCVSVMETLVV